MTTLSTTTTADTGTLNLWSSADGRIEVLHHFGGNEPRIEIVKDGAAPPVLKILTTRFWRAEQLEAIEDGKRLAAGQPLLALTDTDTVPADGVGDDDSEDS